MDSAPPKRMLAPFLAWAVLAALLIFLSWDHIQSGSGWDPDDQLRLVQLRDFLNGQGWFDTTQYRMNAPDGAPMHWSRLIELPLAALIVMLAPLFGQGNAEILASIIVPLGCYAIVATMMAQIAGRIGGPPASMAAIIMTMVAPAISMQLRPMRIDHHGWQLVCAAIALAAMFWASAWRAGIALGLSLAIWLHISLEGAPAAAVFFAVLGLQWLWDGGHAQRLMVTVGSFTLASLALFFATQGKGLAGPDFCDTISPVHIQAILGAAFLMLVALVRQPQGRAGRALWLAGASAAAGAVLAVQAPLCLRGAFVTLDPVVRDYWYYQVSEGMPIWQQTPQNIAMFSGVALAGLISLAALWRLDRQDLRADLLRLAPFQISAFVMALLVFRTISAASLFAIPVLALAIARLFARYRAAQKPVHRVGAILVMAALLMPGPLLTQLVALAAPPPTGAPSPYGAQIEPLAEQCNANASIARLRLLPKANIIAPFDLGPIILATTPHNVLASSHHRNQIAMRDHIDIFRLPPEQARQIIRRRHISHIATCGGEVEMQTYIDRNPGGLWAAIASGRPPEWLHRVDDPALGQLRVWQVHTDPR